MKKIYLVIMLAILMIITGCGKSNSNSSTTKKDDVKIVQSETKKMEYEEYNNGYIKMQIPKVGKLIFLIKLLFQDIHLKCIILKTKIIHLNFL